MKVYGARRGERGPTGHSASMGFIMVMVNEEQRDAALLNRSSGAVGWDLGDLAVVVQVWLTDVIVLSAIKL